MVRPGEGGAFVGGGLKDIRQRGGYEGLWTPRGAQAGKEPQEASHCTLSRLTAAAPHPLLSTHYYKMTANLL